jgi:hypothetical protein
MNAISPKQIEFDPIEIDPTPCGECGLTIDRHQRVDTAEGPEFFCIDLWPDEMTLDELERRAELRRQEEVAAIFARLEAMDRPPEIPLAAESPAYCTAASTIDAFWYVVGLRDSERFKAWLVGRPEDAPFLLKLIEGK